MSITSALSLSLAAVTAGGAVPSPASLLRADAVAIVVVVVIVLVMLWLVLSGRRKKGAAPDAAARAIEDKQAAAPEVVKTPATKETFEPLPARPEAEEKKVEKRPIAPEPEAEDEGEVAEAGAAWELAESEEEAAALEAMAAERAREAEATKLAEEKAREAEARKQEAEERAREAEQKRKEAEDKARAAEGDVQARALAERAQAEAKVAAEAKKKAEQEARAEAARAAEARDKAIKEAAERAKAEAKAAAEAEARAKAEARRKESEARAKAEAESKAKAEAEEAKKREAEAKAKKKAKDKEKKELEREVDKPAAAELELPARTLKDGLGKTRKEGFIAKLSGLFAGKQIDEDLLDEVEEALFTADIGVRTADRLLQAVREALSKKELKDPKKVWEILRGEAQKILESAHSGQAAAAPEEGKPFVTMVLGVNGTGKTTSIGKMAHKLLAEGKSVTLVAGDTFRAAATEQLEHWARRVGAPCIKGKEGADPASVVFDGVKQAVEDKAQHVLVDTAGRLHNNTNLMEELKKVRRVMGKAIDGAPQEVLMVLDATTGQNGIAQAKQFKEATQVTGIILTKLDGTAKGGVVLGVCDELKIPIRFVGVGERVADLRVFDPKEFVDELFAPPA